LFIDALALEHIVCKATTGRYTRDSVFSLPVFRYALLADWLTDENAGAGCAAHKVGCPDMVPMHLDGELVHILQII